MRVDDPNHPILLEQPMIEGLPDHIKVVPTEPEEWLRWSRQVTAYRETVRRRCADDKREQQAEIELCRRDPCYWMVMYGVVFEPRHLFGMSPRWMRAVLYPFQVQLVRWIQAVMLETENGRGDGVCEKSRDMTVSWTFCLYMAWAWLFEDVFVAGVVSRNAAQVDRTGASDTLFYKIRANLALEDQVPPGLKLPSWMVPPGMTDEHSVQLTIFHPTKTCIIQGETSTAMAGVGGRATMRLNDEAARFMNFDEAWANQNATTEHRFAVSSADMVSPGFRELAEYGKKAVENKYMHGPSYLRLNWWHHPFHTQEWYEDQRARNMTQPHWFRREYDIDYYAGAGDNVYPAFLPLQPGEFPYDPTLEGALYCSIDPGVSDPCAIVWIQEDRKMGRYRVVKGFETPKNADPEFVASILVGVQITGYGGYDYSDPYLQDLMKWTAGLRRKVIYYGDPAGNARGGDGKRTFYEAVTDKTGELTGNMNKVTVNTITQDSARTYEVRMRALNSLVSRIDVDQDWGARYFLEALKESRFPERSPNRAYTKEVTEPQHDQYSHRRTTMEFWAVNITALRRVDNARRDSQRRAKRISMSGRIMRT
jgi:hypothetical protein